jgi:hypothetical protein
MTNVIYSATAHNTANCHALKLQEWHKRIAALMAAQAKRREEARLEHGASNINTAAATRGNSHTDAAATAAAASAAAAATAAANAPAHESEKHYSETLTAIVEAREKLRRQQAE